MDIDAYYSQLFFYYAKIVPSIIYQGLHCMIQLLIINVLPSIYNYEAETNTDNHIRWCFCGGDDAGDMIGCDNEICK